MTETPDGGLRERKKRATRQAIEHGALELALEHGYENVTVEMICERAMISPRTFFNYAGSKERAVLGIKTPLPGEEQRRAYVAGLGGSPLTDLVVTIAGAFSDFGEADTELFRRRQQVLQANPELAMKEFARMEEAQNSVVDLVRERLVLDGTAEARPGSGLDDEARMVVSLTFGIMHYLVRSWIETGAGNAPADPVRPALELARRIARA